MRIIRAIAISTLLSAILALPAGSGVAAGNYDGVYIGSFEETGPGIHRGAHKEACLVSGNRRAVVQNGRLNFVWDRQGGEFHGRLGADGAFSGKAQHAGDEM